MYFEPVIVTQTKNQPMLQSESDSLSDHLRKKVITSIFPSGERWESYENARSFRFVQLDQTHYLLSYTLILGESYDTWNGRLHAWGLIGTREQLIGTDGLGMFAPQELFEFYVDLFKMDFYYQVMIEGLAQAPSLNAQIKFSWWKKLLLHSNRLGYRWQYNNPIQWSIVEMFTYQTFCKKMMTARFRNGRNSPVTFSTFSLSADEPANIKGLPSCQLDRPQISLI